MFGRIELFQTYIDVENSKTPILKREQLRSSGVLITDAPHLKRKEVADKV